VKREDLLKVVDHLEALWAENQAARILLVERLNVSPADLDRAFQHHTSAPSTQAQARQMFEPLRASIQASPQAEELLEALRVLFEKIAKGNGR
jgi:hypothetical protein